MSKPDALERSLDSLPMWTIDEDRIYELRIKRAWHNTSRVWRIGYHAESGEYFHVSATCLPDAVDRMRQTLTNRLRRRLTAQEQGV